MISNRLYCKITMVFWTVALLYFSVSTISQVKCDADGEASNRRQTAADNDPTWLTLWDSRGRTYKYLSVNGDGDGDKLPLGRDSALVTLLLSLRLGGSKHVNGSGAANAAAAESTSALTNDLIRGPDPSETTSTRPRPAGATATATTTTTTTTTTTARPPLAETTTVTDVNGTAVTAPRQEIGPDDDDDVVKSTSDPPANGTAVAPDSKDELLRAVGPRRDDDKNDVRLKIVLTVRSPRRASAAHDDDGNDSLRGKSAVVDAEDYNYLETDP